DFHVTGVQTCALPISFLAGSGVAFSTRVLRAARVRRDEAGFVSSTSFRGASGGGAAEPRDEPVFFAEEATEATLEAELRAPLRGADDGGLRGVRAVMGPLSIDPPASVHDRGTRSGSPPTRPRRHTAGFDALSLMPYGRG